jgi:hypothetical protein
MVSARAHLLSRTARTDLTLLCLPLGRTLFIMYLMMLTVVMMNLLIAMMATTYDAVNANSEQEWQMERAVMVKAFSDTSMLPLPFNLIKRSIALAAPIVTLVYNAGGS